MSVAKAVREDVDAILLPDEDATAALGARIGAELRPGDLVALSGAVGAGKTTLARAILRHHLGDPVLEVPSPTFTLTQHYESAAGSVVHADLYRVLGEGELVELGFEDWQDGAAVLVEWPERAPTLLARARLDVHLTLDPAEGRHATLSGSGPLAERVARAVATGRLLAEAGWADAVRHPLAGDASSRLYERLEKPGGARALLMVSPPRPDGPPVRRGKPYSAIAHLAESVHAFAAMARGLLDQGLSAPRILAENLEAGLLLIEDFGDEPVADGEGPIAERYAETVRLLAALHGRPLPGYLPLAPERQHAIPHYDLDAFRIEVELLLDWYVPFLVGHEPSGSVRAEFDAIWRELLGPLVAGPQTWTLRDVHSPNLIWLPGREGIRRVGLLDFQDCVLGPPAYDVASLLQDARVTVPPELELRLLGTYVAARRATDPGFDTAAFAAAYAIMGAQRATKILGIFARLDRRDGKPRYLAHLPRVRAYLARNLAHPALARLRGWFENQLPDVLGEPEHGEAVPSPELTDGVPPPPPSGRPPLPEGEGDADRAATSPPPPGEGDPAQQGGGGARPEPVPSASAGSASAAAFPAMVLAAGLGTRMRPITDTLPKPLVTVGGRTMLDHALRRLAAAGVPRAVVNVHHLAERIEAHLAAGTPLPVEISDERDALLETGGGVARALPRLGPAFLVLNSDSLWVEHGTANVAALAEVWRPEAMDALLLLAPRDSLGYAGGGDFHLAADGRLRRRAPGGDAPHVYAGVAILARALFDDGPAGAFSLNLVFDRAAAADRLYGLPIDGEWLHVGTPDAIPAAEERLAAGS